MTSGYDANFFMHTCDSWGTQFFLAWRWTAQIYQVLIYFLLPSSATHLLLAAALASRRFHVHYAQIPSTLGINAGLVPGECSL
jgi:hypothetical protein